LGVIVVVIVDVITGNGLEPVSKIGECRIRHLMATGATENCDIAYVCTVQSTDKGQGRQHHVVSLDLLSVNMSDAGTYDCLVKPSDGAAVSATANFTVYGIKY